MRAAAVTILLVACAHAPAPPPAAVAAPLAPAPVAGVAVAPAWVWPVPVRVMMWTGDAPHVLGALPGPMPAIPAGAAWYVEPIAALDAHGAAALADAIRHEHVPGLSLRGQPVEAWAGGVDAYVHELPDLVALSLDDTAVSELPAIAPQLRRLYLARTRVDNASLVDAPRRLAQLEVLSLAGDVVTDTAPIAQLTALRALDLSDTALRDSDGARLGALHDLEVLDLGHTDIGAHTVAAIRDLPLRVLLVDGTHASREVGTLVPLAATLERLDASDVRAAPLGDGELAWLTQAAHLEEASLGGAAIHDDLVHALIKLPALRTLRISGAKIARATTHDIAARGHWDDLDLAKTAVDDAAVAALLALPELRALRVDDTAIDDAALPTAPAATLVELYASRTHVRDARVAALVAHLPDLVALGLAEDDVGDATLAEVAKLHALRTLALDGTHGSERALAQAVGGSRALERLYVANTFADDSVVAALVAPELRVLHVSGTQIDDDALPALRALPRLEELTLGDTRIARPVDVTAWPRLRTLSLVGLGLGDSALAELVRGGGGLARLDLSYTEVRDVAPLAALPRLRELGLVATKLAPAGEAAASALAARGVDVIR